MLDEEVRAHVPSKYLVIKWENLWRGKMAEIAEKP